ILRAPDERLRLDEPHVHEDLAVRGPPVLQRLLPFPLRGPTAMIRFGSPSPVLRYPFLMPDPLASQPSLDPDAMWRTMRVLLDRVFGVIEQDSAFDDCLDIVVELLGADRGLVLVVDEVGTPRTIHARACRKPLGPLEREEISKTIIRQALETG